MRENEKELLIQSSIEAKTLEQIIKSAIEHDQEEGQAKPTINPYMSEEIQSVLKQMGEYLLEEDDDEIAAALAFDYEEEMPPQAELLKQAFKERHYEILQGKHLTEDIRTTSGHYIGRQGDLVTYHMIILAEENRCLLKLVMNSN